MDSKQAETAAGGIQVADVSTMGDVLQLVGTAIADKKGEDIVVLDLRGAVDYLDYMVICTGNTEIQNRAIVDNIEARLAGCDIIPERLHGYNHGKWILLDYDILVVHVFTPELREYYRLEDLWAGGQEVSLA